MSDSNMPMLYLPHGGGPLPLLGEAGHRSLVNFLSRLADDTPRPRAIVMVSAHWETAVATVSGAVQPDMIYDYYGFPEAAYSITYPAPGSATLATRLLELLSKKGIAAACDKERGFDHGTFVPLMLMYPQADIPVVQLSLLESLDAERLLEIGAAIASVSSDGVMLIGSGMSFHNMDGFRSGGAEVLARSREFDDWLNELITSETMSGEQKRAALLNWQSAPQARYCHPREEHLLPLHVCFAAANQLGLKAENVFREPLLGAQVSGFVWR